jgi:glycosyltransferase involved in cell wall biosynthesis
LKKKILLILQYPPPNHGASFVGELIKDSEIINSEYYTRYINSNLSDRANVIGKFKIKKIFIYAKILVKVLKELILFKPNVCYFSITSKTTGFFKDFLVGMIIKLFNNKIIFHFHNKGISTVENIFYYDFCYKVLFKNTKAIILSERLYFDVKKYFKRDDVYICPNGIPFFIDKPMNSPKPINSIKIRLLFLSNLFKAKGVKTLLKACKILDNKKVAYSCDFIGDEGDISKTDFEKIVNDLNLNHSVNYHGKKYGIEKNLFFINSDIFIHPTSEDCFPIVLLEALKFSLPIISTNVGAIQDIVIDNYNGFVLKDIDSISLAKSIISLSLNPKLIDQMGYNSNKLFKEKYQQKVFENNFINILKII